MKITLALQSPEQVTGACRTTAHHVRLGYPYCSLVAQCTWPINTLRDSINTIIGSGKRPQLFLPFSPLEKSEEGYWQQNIDLLSEFPQTEVIISNWGVLKLPVTNNKIASTHLNALNHQEISLLSESGVKIVALPLSLRNGNSIRSLIANNEQVDFEYHLDGEVLTNFTWRCQSEPGTSPKGNGNWCLAPETFISQAHDSLPSMQSKGNTVWLGQQMATLQQVQGLNAWGVKRGVINWGRYDFDTIEQLITLYQVVLAKGTDIITDNEFFQSLRKQIRFHYFN